MAYYPDWAGFPPEKIDFNRFDWIDFAFALPTSNYDLTWDAPAAPGFLTRLITCAHAKGKHVKLSIGGWTGSKYFSSAVSTSKSRETFVENIVGVYQEFNLDGIDIDWEYPGRQGAGNNQVNKNDSANFLSFLQLLRCKLPSSAVITAATLTTTFSGSNGQSMRNVTAFAQVLDWILMMNYDVWGASSKPGPNAPLSNACKISSQPDASAEAGSDAWTAAGMPPNKQVLGVPSYAYLSRSNATRLQTRRSSPVQLVGDGDQIQFNEIVKQGALVRTGTLDNYGPRFDGSGGYTRCWDSCSSTPFLRSPSAGQVVTYDDPQSLGMKAAFARRRGMRGVNMFDVHGDTDDWDLADSIRRGLGCI
ncbi:glycoside hydrolase [Mycena maculata]|uniref:Glycoside hydrolase n=1 Tax=Mycena maculata TaxID=230809 RepID=A0AAD7NL53_9AGAR|nr:glycoside hydrolase [Mycena maculata]